MRRAPLLQPGVVRDTPFKVVALWCAYEGRGFCGYQGQAGLRTVQGELLRAFAAAGLPRNPVVAGRTDKGVSARMQVLSARVGKDEETGALERRLNAHLPQDLRVVVARDAPQAFHAAWSASGKAYRYRLAAGDVGDVELLTKAAALVPGTRDFRVFHHKTAEVKPRTVESVALVREASGGFSLRFDGVQFARHMVRMLVGGLLAVATGEVPLEAFTRGLEQQENFHCPVAPAEPLTLWEVRYPPEVDPFPAEVRARVLQSQV